MSTQRAGLGAYQNRLKHKISNLDTSSENLQAAESRIRDVNIAHEMTEYTKNNILGGYRDAGSGKFRASERTKTVAVIS